MCIFAKIIYHLFMLYWAFYKSTVILNIAVSFALASLATVFSGDVFTFCIYFPGSFATIGLLFVFLYKEIAFPLEYYFYYNRGITKIKLFIFCFLINVLPATLILTILHYAALS